MLTEKDKERIEERTTLFYPLVGEYYFKQGAEWGILTERKRAAGLVNDIQGIINTLKRFNKIGEATALAEALAKYKEDAE